MTEITAHERKLIIQDAGYLQEELTALKSVIRAVPYADRPLEQESIFDMIHRIGHAQSSFFLPVIRFVLNSGSGKNDIPDGKATGAAAAADLETDSDLPFSPDYHVTFRPHHSEDISVDALIDRITAVRKDLVSLLESAPLTLLSEIIPVKGRSETRLYDLLQEMVTYERNQLKKVAERVLSIEVDHRSGSDNHNTGVS